MNTAATEIGDGPSTSELLSASERRFDPDATGWCRCQICKPDWYARGRALHSLDAFMEQWSDVLVDTENAYTQAGDDPLFDALHVKLNRMKDEVVDAINFEEDRLSALRGE